MLKALSFILVLFGLAETSLAQNTAAEVLALVDAEIGKSTDQFLIWEMITAEPGKAERRMTFEVTVKGKRFRRVEFLAPADVKGTRILVLSTDQMYIYLPAFKKIRRIASHVKEQGFMGSAWSHDEFALAVFGEIFSAQSKSEHDKYWTLKLERKPGNEFTYPNIEVDVRKDLKQPVEIRYLNDKGVTVKTESRTEFSCGQGFCTPHKVIMVDHIRAEITTTMLLKDWQVNRKVPDSFFTVRALQQGI